MIALLLQSLTGLTQIDSTSLPRAWSGPDGSICMTLGRAALLLNAEDSLKQLYEMNGLLEEALMDSRILAQLNTETINNLLAQKVTLQSKIKVLEDRLNLKSDKITLYLDELQECDMALDKANKKLKRQKTATTVTSIISGSAIVAIIVTVLTIVF